MDFASFDTTGPSNEGRPLHLLHPATGEPLYTEDGTPCVVLVLGMEGDVAQAQLAEMAKLPKLAEGAAMSELNDRFVLQAQHLVVGFPSGINRGSRPCKAPEDVLWFLSLQKINPLYRSRSFVEQILFFSSQRSEFIKKSEGGSSSPPINGAGSTQRRKAGRKTVS